MALTEHLQRTLTGFIFESAIIILIVTILVLIRRHYARRKTKYTQQMYYIFICLTFAVIFSWLAKFLQLLIKFDSYDTMDPNMPLFWLLSPIIQFRVSFAFMGGAGYLTFRLGGRIFDLKRHPIIHPLVIIYTVGNILFSLIFVAQRQGMWDIIAFVLALIEMIISFVPFAVHSFKMGKRLHEPLYKKASFSLGIMSVAFILIFVGFLLDRILIILFDHRGYSIFYFASWTMSIVGMASAYLGYIRPGEKQHLAVQARKEAEAEAESESESDQ